MSNFSFYLQRQSNINPPPSSPYTASASAKLRIFKLTPHHCFLVTNFIPFSLHYWTILSNIDCGGGGSTPQDRLWGAVSYDFALGVEIEESDTCLESNFSRPAHYKKIDLYL